MSRTRPQWVEALLFVVALVLLGFALVTSSGCAVVGRLAAGAAQAVVECGRSPQVEREARKALDDVAAEAKLDELAKSSGWDVVVCAVEWLLRSLTGAAQADGELLAMSSDTRATKEYLQPQVDRARAWLALRKGAKR